MTPAVLYAFQEAEGTVCRFAVAGDGDWEWIANSFRIFGAKNWVIWFSRTGSAYGLARLVPRW